MSSLHAGLAQKVPAAAELNSRGLDEYLKGTLPGLVGDLRIEQTVGGMSNPSYFLAYDNWDAVLRKQPAGLRLSKSAHRIDREFRVLRALHSSSIPVPEPLLYCEDSDIVGTPFYLMERIRGRVFASAAMPGLPAGERRACYVAMCEAMAAVHRFDYAAAGLEDFGKPDNYFNRQISAWAAQWDRLRTPENPYIDILIDWLRANLPPGDHASLCHGDFRVANIMFHPTEPRIVGVLDWELSTIGHPLADVAFNLQAWRLRPDQNGGILGLDLDALGIPAEAEYLAHYYAITGGTELLMPFHLAFAMFRASVGVAGAAARGGAAGSLQSAFVGEAKCLALAYALIGMKAAEIPFANSGP